MAESLLHMNLVQRIASYVGTITPSFASALLDADLPEYGQRTPKVIDGYYPDVRYIDKNIIAIGEAKTSHDILNDHTDNQLMAYINEIRTYTRERHIIYCVPFVSFIQVKNILKRLKKSQGLDDIRFHVLDNFNRIAVI